MYSLSIVTRQKKVFEGEVKSLTAPGSLGYLEILSYHAPLITTLATGKLSVTDAEKAVWVYAVSGGILEVASNQATLLGEAVERYDEIDIRRAEMARDRALRRLESKDPSMDRKRTQNALKRAENRITVFYATHPASVVPEAMYGR